MVGAPDDVDTRSTFSNRGPDVALLDLLSRILAAVVAAYRFLQQPTRARAGVALMATGALVAY